MAIDPSVAEACRQCNMFLQSKEGQDFLDSIFGTDNMFFDDELRRTVDNHFKKNPHYADTFVAGNETQKRDIIGGLLNS
jgi:hypothetical protein